MNLADSTHGAEDIYRHFRWYGMPIVSHPFETIVAFVSYPVGYWRAHSIVKASMPWNVVFGFQRHEVFITCSLFLLIGMYLELCSFVFGWQVFATHIMCHDQCVLRYDAADPLPIDVVWREVIPIKNFVLQCTISCGS